jgi:hypothetical protein
MKKSLFIGLFSVVLLFRLADAQTTAEETPVKEPLPPGPLIVTKMPDFAQWSIDFTYPPAAKAGQSSQSPDQKNQSTAPPGQYRPIRIVLTKTGDVTHEESVFENNLKGEMWCNRDTGAARLPNSSALVAEFSNGSVGNAFPDFDWISKENYVGTLTHDQVKCLVFKQKQYDFEGGFLGMATAYIDIKTRYPVEYNRNAASRIYTIMDPPTEQLVIPDEFLTAGKAMKDRLEKATPHLAPP